VQNAGVKVAHFADRAGLTLHVQVAHFADRFGLTLHVQGHWNTARIPTQYKIPAFLVPRVLGQLAVNYTRCAPSEDLAVGAAAAKPKKKKGSKTSKKKK
ncbi:hypothetical protein T484DRAFT_1813303, partial [Baffinella frigidus]